jgi:hypothetical protein
MNRNTKIGDAIHPYMRASWVGSPAQVRFLVTHGRPDFDKRVFEYAMIGRGAS